MYEVIDGYDLHLKVMGTYKTRNRAIARADKLDLEYGAVRYYVRHAESKQYASRFVTTLS